MAVDDDDEVKPEQVDENDNKNDNNNDNNNNNNNNNGTSCFRFFCRVFRFIIIFVCAYQILAMPTIAASNK
jgi:hypothetical protein